MARFMLALVLKFDGKLLYDHDHTVTLCLGSCLLLCTVGYVSDLVENQNCWFSHAKALFQICSRYVLPNHMLLQICGILPREKQGILACCNPIPPLVRQYLNELHAMIVKARESPLHKVLHTNSWDARLLCEP